MDGIKWYENTPLVTIKFIIKDNANTAVRSFVAIGYYLKDIRDRELYLEDGYKSIWEFAQGEFGIGKSSTSRFMAINDRFSKDGNSPILLDQYKDFSSSKLSEMLTLSDEQVEQVTITTTVAEIREMKQPAKEDVVATSQQEPKIINPTAIDNLELSVRTYNCLKRAGIDTVEELCRLTEIEVVEIRNISRKCLDEIKLKLSEIGKELKADIPETVNDTSEIVDNDPEIVNDVDDECSGCKLNDNADAGILECHQESGEHKCWMGDNEERDQVETVEADIIQTETEPSPPWKQKQVIKDSIKQEEEMLNQLRETWKTKQPDTLVKHETLLMAYKRFLIELEHPNPEPVKPEQPDLPIFKNNDQRKEWIEAYPTWPLWIDSKETEERYYRYDFENGEAFVIRVGMHHKYLGWDKGGYSKTETEYNHEEYWIVKAGKLFSECEASKSTMVDYLKEIQKK